jgi:hypothetical protein
MATPNSETSARMTLEGVIAWTSVAYASGFFVVLLHTARLGLPVIELIEPVYVWIGLPFAILGFFADRLLSLLRARSMLHRDQLLNALRKSEGGTDLAGEVNFMSGFVDEASRLMPWFVPAKWVAASIGRRIEKMLVAAGPDSERRSKLLRLLDFQMRALRAANAVQGIINLANIAVLTAGSIFFYVIEVYPRIPQAYGGGAPISVRLLVDSTKVPSLVAANRTGVILSSQVDLLYHAADTYWIRSAKSAQGCVLDPTVDALQDFVLPNVSLDDPGLASRHKCLIGLEKSVVSGVVLVH